MKKLIPILFLNIMFILCFDFDSIAKKSYDIRNFHQNKSNNSKLEFLPNYHIKLAGIYGTSNSTYTEKVLSEKLDFTAWLSKKEYKKGEKLQLFVKSKNDVKISVTFTNSDGELTKIPIKNENIKGGKMLNISNLFKKDIIIQKPYGKEKISITFTTTAKNEKHESTMVLDFETLEFAPPKFAPLEGE